MSQQTRDILMLVFNSIMSWIGGWTIGTWIGKKIMGKK